MINSKLAQLVLVFLLCFSCYSKADQTCTTNLGTDGTCNPYTGNVYDQQQTENLLPTNDFVRQYGNGNFEDHNAHQNKLIRFSYQESLFKQTVAINQALEASGITVDGLTYGWKYLMACNNSIGGYCGDPNGPNDTLDFEVIVTDENGDVVYQSRYSYEDYFTNWRSVDVVSYAPDSVYTTDEVYSAEMRIKGKDTGYWAGNYGPIVTDTYLTFIYRSDPCSTDPLYDSSCEGYADAYAEQQYTYNCQANPLYDSGCPGYQEAYRNQQCNADPLYDQSCPGYEWAFYNNQCEQDPLYDYGCPGYNQAYTQQQCEADPLYDYSCEGYEKAYIEKQCEYDPMYSQTCSGYDTAYAERFNFIEPEFDFDYKFDFEKDFEIAETDFSFEQFEFNTEFKVEEKFETTTIEPSFTTPEIETFEIPTFETFETETFTTFETTDFQPEFSVPELTVENLENMIQDLEKEFDIEIEMPTTEELETRIEEIKVAEVEENISEPIIEIEVEVEVQETIEETAKEEEKNEPEISEVKEETPESLGSGEKEESSDNTLENNEPDPREEKTKEEPAAEETKEDKKRKLVAVAAAKTATALAEATSIAEQSALQSRLIALLGYNPDFNTYGNVLPTVNFYKDTVLPDGKIEESRRGLRNGLAQQILHEKMIDMQYNNN